MKIESQFELTEIGRSFLINEKSPTGLIWARNAAHGKRQGDVAGCLHKPSGYSVVGVGRRLLKAHRVVWILENGPIPDGLYIDHLNGVRSDNRVVNLRIVSKAENNRARNYIDRRNTSGYMGVFWNKALRRWKGEISRAGTSYMLGWFDDSRDAARAFNRAAVDWATANGEKARFLNPV